MGLKKWYRSKTIWVNIIALLAILVQYIMGEKIIDAETEAAILSVINLILRLVTNKGLTT